jgi:hypothetical protein
MAEGQAGLNRTTDSPSPTRLGRGPGSGASKPTLRQHIITLIIAIYVIVRFINVGLTVPHNYVEDAREGTPVNCADVATWYAAQYLAAPDVLDSCSQ